MMQKNIFKKRLKWQILKIMKYYVVIDCASIGMVIEKKETFIQQAFDLHNTDAEVIYNLVEIYLLEFDYKRAKRMIKYFYDKHDKIETFDKDISFYDNKIWLFAKFVEQNAPTALVSA